MNTPIDTAKKTIIPNTTGANAASSAMGKPADTPTPTAPTPTKPATPAIPKVTGDKFQHYSCARSSMTMITEKGKKIAFTGYKYITNDDDRIEYIDQAIKDGVLGITKGELLTADEADPMAELKRKHIAEYLETQAKAASDKALGITADMGNSKAPGAPSINPANTNHVAN